MTNKKHGTLYIGMTSDLTKRVWEHKNAVVEGFTKKYGLHDLVYFEAHEDAKYAAERELQMKAWKRQWKINLIEGKNPEWKDLYAEIVG